MRIDLLPRKQAFKANLHTHSNLSDGKLPPEQLAELYRGHGYQVLSITDHEFFVDHSGLNREDFLMLTGYELQLVDETEHPRKFNQRCCHLGIISKDPHHFKHVYFNPESYDLLRLCKIPEAIPQMESVGKRPGIKEYGTDVIAEVVRTCVENNMLVAFNHPSWSLENDYDSYRYLDGVYAMEIYNNDSYLTGVDEYNPAVYDRMLRDGVRAGCIAADDTHASYPLGDPRCDLFGGWTMILADELTYDSVISALERRDFYASTGPEIKELYYEDGLVHVKTSDAVRIAMGTCGRRSGSALALPGQCINEAEFPVREDDQYIRITVKDREGHTAFTRGYFLDEFHS